MKAYPSLCFSIVCLFLFLSHLVQAVNTSWLRWCARDGETHLSVCQYADGNQGCIFSWVFPDGASNDLSTCWAFQNGFYFDLHQQGMEWSPLGLSIWAPVDPSEARSSPEMRRHGADLLFRSYSSPVDKKTIELCCWSSRGRARVVQNGRSSPWTETERWEGKTDRKRCQILVIALGDFLSLWSDLCADEKQRWECCLQWRLLIFPKMSTKSLGSKVKYELRECNRGQVCISSLMPHWFKEE